MTNTLKKVLQRLVSEAKAHDSPVLFRNQHGKPLRIYALRDAFEIAVERAGILDFHLHDLRHTFASRLVMAGVDLRTVQELMGHKTIAMTLRYAHLSSDHKRKAIEALEQRFSEKSPINFHNTAVFAPLSEAKKAM